MKNLFLAIIFALLGISSVHAEEKLSEYEKAVVALKWVKPPAVAELGDKAKLTLTKDHYFLGDDETQKFLKLNQNLPQPNSYTLFYPDDDWFAIFHFMPEGYIKDDEKIDSDALMSTLKAQNKESIEERKKQGLPPLYLDGWYIPPHYDPESKRLEWATKIHDEQNNPMVNFTVRILGRGGYMSATLVSNPKSLDQDIKSFKTSLTKFEYNPGERYAEFQSGDKVAAYGLGAFFFGGSSAAVASKGGFKFLWAIALAGFAAVSAFFKKIFGKK